MRDWGAAGPRALVIVALVLAAALPARAAGDTHEDERVGFRLRVPKGWNQMPLPVEERWIVGKYLSDKASFYTDPIEKWTYDHKPVLTIIAFVDEVVKKRRVERTTTDEGEVFLELNNPFKDYQDYLKRTYSGGGWYVAAEEETEVNGLPCVQYEVSVEKLTSTGPKRIVTWVYDLEDVKVAVEFEVLADAWKKLKSDVLASLRSFRRIPRTTGSLTPTTTGGPVKRVDEETLSQADRSKHRVETEQQVHERAKNALPDDWTAKEMGRFLVLNHADDKYAKKVVAHAEAVWDWLDKTFPDIGIGEYVRHPILRICKDWEEESSFRSGTSGLNSLEIVTHQDTGSGALSYEFEYVNTRILEIWFFHRDRDLYWAMPQWLRRGLRQVLGTARSKGSKLDFRPDDWERDGLRESARKGELTSPRDLVLLSGQAFYENPNRAKQSAAFLRFLMESRSRKTKTLVRDYLKNLSDVLAEKKKEEAAKQPEPTKAPETEEEEEARFRERSKRLEEGEREFLQAVFDRTFGDWDDKDWKSLEAQYFKTID